MIGDFKVPDIICIDDLLASWTLVEADWELVANKRGATRRDFALLLKFFELEARFPV